MDIDDHRLREKNSRSANAGEAASATDEDFTRVEVERMDDDPRLYGERPQMLPLPRPPYFSTWICLILAWLFLGSAVPFTVFIGLPFAVAALMLAWICLARGAFFTGITVMLLGTVGSVLVYIVGLFKFIGLFF